MLRLLVTKLVQFTEVYHTCESTTGEALTGAGNRSVFLVARGQKVTARNDDTAAILQQVGLVIGDKLPM